MGSGQTRTCASTVCAGSTHLQWGHAFVKVQMERRRVSRMGTFTHTHTHNTHTHNTHTTHTHNTHTHNTHIMTAAPHLAGWHHHQVEGRHDVVG